MKTLAAILAFFVLLPHAFAQTKKSHPASAASDPDLLGLTCAQILEKTSTDWVSYFAEKSAPAEPNSPAAVTTRAIAAYGKCYDARTARLAGMLGKTGKGPLMGANGNFRDFQSAVDAFTSKSLAATKTAEDSPRAAYAHLYEKQFRYQFYQSYAHKDLKGRPLTPEESDEFAKAKNRFGEVLGLLPDADLHAVHSAFRQIFGSGSVPDVTKLELYRYAIFLLAPAKDKPFSPPPF
ncbi:MAG TPA: hypothetical protein VGD60_02290 [Candidatus Acidoferrales bacterium]